MNGPTRKPATTNAVRTRRERGTKVINCLGLHEASQHNLSQPGRPGRVEPPRQCIVAGHLLCNIRQYRNWTPKLARPPVDKNWRAWLPIIDELTEHPSCTAVRRRP